MGMHGKLRRSGAGFSLIELLAMVAVVVLLAGLMMRTTQGDRKGKAQRIKCVSNLKNLGLAFRVFSLPAGDSFPGRFLMSNGVEMSSIDAVNVFGMMSNEVSNPKIFVCPSDKERTAGQSLTNLTAKNISYFPSISADETMPSVFLAGDRNMATNGVAVGSGLFGLTTNVTGLSWTKELHNEQGNVLMGDGSVRQMSSSRLRSAVANQGIQTNYLVMP
jgi:prepilin-type processing-associated H-X9-DG protein